MKKIYNNVTELIGNTPVVKIQKFAKLYGLEANLIVKLESFNPGGSVKDRIAFAMIEKARKDGIITEGATIIEPTSGNTGVGLAMVCAYFGYKTVLVMPDTMSVERRGLLKAYGAKIVLTPGSEGMKGAIKKAIEISNETPNSFIPSQFENPANPEIHRNTTGVEIYEDLDGNLDFFVSGIGTGGTITGAGEYLKSKVPNLKVIAVEPENSPVLSKGTTGPHKIQGIGAGFVPNVLNTSVYDEVITISNDEAFNASRDLAISEGILVGISSGAALYAGVKIANRPENKGKTIVIILPDTGERYLSTNLFDY